MKTRATGPAAAKEDVRVALDLLELCLGFQALDVEDVVPKPAYGQVLVVACVGFQIAASLGVFATLALSISSMWVFAESYEWPWFAASVLGVGAAALLVRRARGQDPWRIWSHLVAAFAVMAAASGPSIFLATEGVTHPTSVYWGGWLYLASLAALLVLAAVTVTRREKSLRGS